MYPRRLARVVLGSVPFQVTHAREYLQREENLLGEPTCELVTTPFLDLIDAMATRYHRPQLSLQLGRDDIIHCPLLRLKMHVTPQASSRIFQGPCRRQ